MLPTSQTLWTDAQLQASAPPPSRPATYEVTLTLDVRSASTLWRAAAQRLQRRGLTAEEIDETIGDIDHPSLSDCLTALMLPGWIEGCRLVDFQIGPSLLHDELPGTWLPPRPAEH